MSVDADGKVLAVKAPSEVKLEVQFNLPSTADLVEELKNPVTRRKYNKTTMQLLSYMLKEGARYGFIVTNRMLIACKR